MTLETLVNLADLDEAGWIDFPKYKFRQYFLTRNEKTGASVALLKFDPGGGVPIAHAHASNQSMYCLAGEYEYTTSNLTLRAGDFYTNPKDHPHGPTVARTACTLIEIYDGPHYYEKPVFHTDETIGGMLAPKLASQA